METLQDWIQELNKSDKIILVEGKKDKKALEEMGIKNIIITISNKPRTFIENVSRGAVILTDLDKQGKKYYSILRSSLQKRGIKVDMRFREFLFKQKVSHIEGIKIP